MPVRSWDFWWHLAFGRVVAATGEMWMTNGFLYTMPYDAPSYVQAWVSQWLLYEIVERFGLHGLLILRSVFAAATALFMTVWAWRRNGSVMTAALVVFSIVPFLFFVIAVRSHLLAWPLFFVTLPIAYAVREGRLNGRALVWLPVITVAWANLHGTFLVPVLVCVAFSAASVADRWIGSRLFSLRQFVAFSAATVVSFAATFVNPRGGEIYGYLQDLPSNRENLTTVTEWFPTTLFFPEGYGALFWVLLVVALVFMFRRRSTLDPVDLFLLLGFSIVAVKHSRALMWFCFVYPVVVPRYLPKLGEEGTAPSSLVSNVIFSVVVLSTVAAIFLLPWTNAHRDWLAESQFLPVSAEPEHRGLVPPETPVAEVRILKDLGAERTRVFHDHRHAGYLLYRLQGEEVPRQMVFVDHRVELPSSRLWRDYDKLSRGESVTLLDDHRVDWVIANAKDQSGLVRALLDDARWRIVRETEFNVTFQRRGGIESPPE